MHYLLIAQRKSGVSGEAWVHPVEVDDDGDGGSLYAAVTQLSMKCGNATNALRAGLSTLPISDFAFRCWLISGKDSAECQYTLGKVKRLSFHPDESDVTALAKLPVTCTEWEERREKLETSTAEDLLHPTSYDEPYFDTPGAFNLGEVSRTRLMALQARARMRGTEEGDK